MDNRRRRAATPDGIESRPAGIVVMDRNGERREPALRAFVWGAQRLRPVVWPKSGWATPTSVVPTPASE
jgi:hypothetical protein